MKVRRLLRRASLNSPIYVLERKLKFSITLTPGSSSSATTSWLCSPAGKPSPSQIAFPLLPSSICLILALTLPPSEYTRFLQAP
ncbi:hypothetical protein E2C01_051473 [Portunus trituberculatus]|uniref:Uncharacterized protein n=1 Tax=Portunus trituberculatus TaxID=210409 RepID=A0A5B7GEW1_PORTR|nr:hypothetical protein [Portunus trituberculatus]